LKLVLDQSSGCARIFPASWLRRGRAQFLHAMNHFQDKVQTVDLVESCRTAS
jgi:hypothetical protein